MLDDLVEFTKVLENNFRDVIRPVMFEAGNLYCPRCSQPRRMKIMCLHYSNALRGHCVAVTESREVLVLNKIAPLPVEKIPTSLFDCKCVQCDATFALLVYFGAGATPRLAILPAISGGLATAHTPDSVAYYLDQASSAHSLSANSAAMTMFRAALEALLDEQGFTTRMLGPKLNDLESGIKAGTAPRWALDLETVFLTAIKDLGNSAIHVGDIAKQAELDNGLIAEVQELFMHLLYIVYEVPHQKAASLSAIQAKAKKMKK